jgi:hypothetical protein
MSDGEYPLFVVIKKRLLFERISPRQMEMIDKDNMGKTGDILKSFGILPV